MPCKEALTREAVLAWIARQTDANYAKHGADRWSRHEFWGVLEEEVLEAFEAIMSDGPVEDLEKEIVQIASVCVRHLETGTRIHGTPAVLLDAADRLRRIPDTYPGNVRWAGIAKTLETIARDLEGATP